MAVTGWPTEAAPGQVATESRWIQMARLWTAEGVVDGIGNELAPTFNAGAVDVASGAAWINGHYAVNDAVVSVPAGSNGLVVLRYTAAGSIWEIAFRAGATDPVQTDAVYELPIALVTSGVVTDRRVIVGAVGGPRGTIGYVQVAANQIGISSTLIDLTGLAATVILPANRRILIQAHTVFTINSGGSLTGNVREGSTNLGRFARANAPGGASFTMLFDAGVVLTPAAGIHTYKLSAQSTGATSDLAAAADSVGFIRVDDLGSA